MFDECASRFLNGPSWDVGYCHAKLMSREKKSFKIICYNQQFRQLSGLIKGRCDIHQPYYMNEFVRMHKVNLVLRKDKPLTKNA